VVEAFHHAGHHVRTFSLDPLEGREFSNEIDVRTGDVTDQQALETALEAIDIVIHLAALLHVLDPSPQVLEGYRRINVQGTTNLVEAATRSGVKRIVLFSTIAVYGRGASGQVLDEGTQPQPETQYARSKLEAEQIVLASKRSDGQPLGVVLRLAAIYGARVKGNYRRLVRSLARGQFVPIGDGRNRRTLIYDRDAARAALLAAQHPDACGGVFNVSDGEFHTMREILSVICAILERKTPRICIPVRPARLGAALLEDTARFFGRRSPVTRATIDKYTEDIAVDSAKIRSELGFESDFTLTDGWRQAVHEMRLEGEL
jgi:UDP-glucose 4-epimerase